MSDIEMAWRTCGDRVNGRIWLNLMGCDIEDANADELIEIFSSTDVPLGRIGLEITEAVGRSRIGEVVTLLQALREAGLAVALDDVGDDRVPLLHVTELPIDLVKLDRCVITGIDSQQPLRAVVQSLSDMCERLDLRILAEGVETVEEEAVLRRLGLRYVQGFLFSRPLSISALRAYLDDPFASHSTGSVA
jgi:EAL domain-containing protein (putative c-di-GMP-specific phosphodiesterase class I)